MSMKRILLWLVIVLVLIVAVLFGNLLLFERAAKNISEGVPIATSAVDKSALLVIDIQEGTTGKLALKESYIKAADSLIRLVNRLVDSASKRNVPVIYVRSEVSNVLVNLINNSMSTGSEGAALDKRLKVVSDFYIPKQKQDAFSNPILDSILIANQVNKLYITGLDAGFCVNSTIEAALKRGYAITVISDAVLSETDSLKVQVFERLKAKGVTFLNSGEFPASVK